jgi:hypothetical protein
MAIKIPSAHVFHVTAQLLQRKVEEPEATKNEALQGDMSRVCVTPASRSEVLRPQVQSFRTDNVGDFDPT